ncbi:MAG: hypothetical protein DWQ31_00960 [Planctomycetota bacterium]|nr:MAG: hypothetical protein DWQ31_00960 [Planctomycetota bacterium]
MISTPADHGSSTRDNGPAADGFLVEVVRMMRQYPFRWTVPTVVCLLCSLVFALVRPDTWQASQALVVRDEGSTRSDQLRAGDFQHVEQMKTVQETILELSRSRSVLAQALTTVGPPAGTAPVGWPSDEAISGFRKDVQVKPPKGADFGTTEVFYVKVKDHDRERARQLVAAVCDQVKRQYQQLRDEKAQSMIDELTQTVREVRIDRDAATARLKKVESGVGSDLAELRILQISPSGNSDLRRRVSSLETELRASESTYRRNAELRRLLMEARGDLRTLVATPNALLESQPGLRRLKDGLIDAQIRFATARARLTDEHPEVVAAIAAVDEVRRHLTSEIELAIRGVDSEMRLAQTQIDALNEQLAQTNERLRKLAGVRAEYAKSTAEITTYDQLLQTAQENLADARASQAAARTASLITLIDTPDTGARPVSMPRRYLLAAGLFGGFAVGMGLLFVTVPSSLQLGATFGLATAASDAQTKRATSVIQETAQPQPLTEPPSISPATPPSEPPAPRAPVPTGEPPVFAAERGRFSLRYALSKIAAESHASGKVS